MKRFITFVMVLLLISTYSFSFAEELNLSGESAILMDYDTMEILYEKNPHLKLYPASTTKALTGILAIEMGNLKDIVKVDDEVISLTKGSHIALDYDEELTLDDMIHALLIQSANDAALAIGKHISGSLGNFIKLMNDKAKELGALNTNFVNPNGLHNDEHVTTAYDLALIGKYAMENEYFRSIVIKPTYEIGPTNKKTEPRYLRSTNLFMLGNDTVNINGKTTSIKRDGVLGGKTGYTPQAQNCLITVAEKGNRKLLVVVLKSSGKEVYADTHKLLNYGFENFDYMALGHEKEFIQNIPLEKGNLPFVAAILEKEFNYPIKKENISKVERKIVVDEEIELPLSPGDSLGKAEFYLGEKLLGSTNLISTAEVDLIKEPSLFSKILSKWYLIVFASMITLRFVYLASKSKKRRRRRRKERSLYGYSGLK